MNQKAEAVLRGNNIPTEGFTSQQLKKEDITPDTLVLAMETIYRNRVQERFPELDEEHLDVLAHFVGDELETLDLYFDGVENFSADDDENSLTKVVDHVLKEHEELYEGVLCLSDTGNVIHKEGYITYKADHNPVSKTDRSRAVILGKNYLPEARYQLFVGRSFTWKHETFTAIYALNLSVIHKEIVAPVKIGDAGYSIVKDKNQAIIMHHAPGMIGMDAIYDRSILYPDADLTSLTAWIESQRMTPEGMGVIDSYQWDKKELVPVKRIIAYTPISLPGEEWIVNSTRPFEELNQPLYLMVRRILITGSVFFLISLLLVILFAQSALKTETQKREIEYLRKLNESHEMLRRKDEELNHYQRLQSLGQMSSHIAHEFNNYLTPIMLYSEMMEMDEELSPSNLEMVGEIAKVSKKAADLSRKLLDFSRQESSLILEPINMTEEVTRSLFMIRSLTPQKVALVTKICEEDCFVMGQKNMMEQILMNLSKNAFDAMEGNRDRARSIEICMTPDLEKKELILTFADTGCGIPKRNLRKIFDPFYTTKRSGKGTGLGLSVINKLVSFCGGKISVESEEMIGTRFTFTFPIVEGQKEGGKGTEHAEISRIVIVDDDDECRNALKSFLKSKGYQCKAYAHPAEVLNMAQNEQLHADVLIADYSMPYMNGVELFMIVRKFYPELTMILISGSEGLDVDWYLKNQYMNAFLPKTDLTEHILEYLL